ncbi:hypothetical protein BV22DRAFT_847247 [Leucogyrophana mollusca]|uniref:Uncharacterized protein n=1 Tax=Leucogyrophana mollusca TaxID=85980 RepID=A0ACB8B220_9AGAM|nr:hypothetical protein BV22DRAFT_847247 [Leucogyrophana mollusca]
MCRTWRLHFIRGHSHYFPPHSADERTLIRPLRTPLGQPSVPDVLLPPTACACPPSIPTSVSAIWSAIHHLSVLSVVMEPHFQLPHMHQLIPTRICGLRMS